MGTPGLGHHAYGRHDKPMANSTQTMPPMVVKTDAWRQVSRAEPARGPDTPTPASMDAGASVAESDSEGQTFWAVRRQRLQALTFETLPSATTVIG